VSDASSAYYGGLTVDTAEGNDNITVTNSPHLNGVLDLRAGYATQNDIDKVTVSNVTVGAYGGALMHVSLGGGDDELKMTNVVVHGDLKMKAMTRSSSNGWWAWTS
jgi:hypothetical protein